MSKEYLIKHIQPNTSGGEVILSISESILLAIAAYKKAGVGKLLLERLYKLYLEGVKTQEDKKYISDLCSILKDKKYTVKSDPVTTNDDPARRFFETHLAYQSLHKNAESLDHKQLAEFTQNLKKRLLALPDKDGSHSKVANILKGNMKDKQLNKYEKEYTQLISKLTKNDFFGLSKKACDNLLQIACGTSLATLNTQVDSNMPVDVYTDSVFNVGIDGRGRLSKKTNDKVRTTAKGLIKSTSPLYYYGDITNAVGEKYGVKKDYSPFLRSVDQAGFLVENQWVQQLFSHQTHVYSNGVSSTTLAQIRNMILEKRLGHSYSKGFFQKYMTTFASLMIYNSGGHGLFEVFAVLKMRLCLELFETESETVEALIHDNLIYKWFYKDQPDVFEKALDATLKYQQTIINKKMLNAQVKKRAKIVIPDLEAPMTLHRAVVNATLQEFEHLLSITPAQAIDNPDENGWTALMVAAQLGKTEYVKRLIAAKAKVDKQSKNLSALEVAIRCEHYDTVCLLLKAGAPVKSGVIKGDGLQKSAPALYFACRQFNMRILQLILDSEEKLNIEEKNEALLVALKMENLDALQLIVSHINKQNGVKFFSDTSKFELLKEAVSLGSTLLIQGILALKIPSAVEGIDYQVLLNIARQKGFLPASELILHLIHQPLGSKMEAGNAHEPSNFKMPHSFFSKDSTVNKLIITPDIRESAGLSFD